MEYRKEPYLGGALAPQAVFLTNFILLKTKLQKKFIEIF